MKLNEQFLAYLEDYQGGMSDVQDDYLVTIRAGLTDYGQYKQALREMMTRARSLNQAYRDLALLEVDIEEMEREIEIERGDRDEFERRRTAIRRDAARVDRVFLQKRIEELEAEFGRFWQQAGVLKGRVGELTPQNRRAMELDFWKHLLLERFVLNEGRWDDKLLRDVAAMPLQVRAELLAAFKRGVVEVRQNYLAKDLEDAWAEDLPLPEGMGRREIRALLDGMV